MKYLSLIVMLFGIIGMLAAMYQQDDMLGIGASQLMIMSMLFDIRHNL